MNTTTNTELARLGQMKAKALQARFTEVTGETTRSPSRVFLLRRISEALQAADDAASDTEAGSVGAVTPEISPAGKPASVGAVKVASETKPDLVTGENLTRLGVTELQTRYVEVVRRPTTSRNRNYLVWKICQALKGRIRVGPRRSSRRDGVTVKVLPLRMEADLVDRLDQAWKRLGLQSRMDLFRKALQAFLAGPAFKHGLP